MRVDVQSESTRRVRLSQGMEPLEPVARDGPSQKVSFISGPGQIEVTR